MVVEGTRKDGDKSSEQTEATLTCLHALVFQLLMEDLHNRGHLGAQQNYGAVCEQV